MLKDKNRVWIWSLFFSVIRDLLFIFALINHYNYNRNFSILNNLLIGFTAFLLLFGVIYGFKNRKFINISKKFYGLFMGFNAIVLGLILYLL